jgi:hypothetical protein
LILTDFSNENFRSGANFSASGGEPGSEIPEEFSPARTHFAPQCLLALDLMPLREFLRTLLDRRASRAKRISDHRRETFWVPMKRQILSHKLHLRVVLVAQAIACAAALANLEIWETEPVRERIASLAVIRAKYLEPFRDDARFTNVRQTGTVTAMELETSDAGYLAKIGPNYNLTFMARAFCCGRSAIPSMFCHLTV